MANTFTSVNTELVGQLVLDQFVASLAPLRAFTLSATDQPAFRGDSVRVLSVQTGSAAADYTTEYSMQGSHAEGIDVNLNKHKYVSLELFDSQWRDSALLEVETFARSKGYALANAVMTDVMSFVSASFLGETVTVAKSTAFSASAVVALGLEADNRNWPDFQRSLILTPTQLSYLKRDTAIQASYAFGSDTVIRKGEIPSIDTFSSVYKTSVVPSQTVGLCCVPNAVVWASRVVEPQNPHSYNSVKVLNDKETGISLTELSWHNPDAGSRRVVWTVEYGVALGNAKGAFLLV